MGFNAVLSIQSERCGEKQITLQGRHGPVAAQSRSASVPSPPGCETFDREARAKSPAAPCDAWFRDARTVLPQALCSGWSSNESGKHLCPHRLSFEKETQKLKKKTNVRVYMSKLYLYPHGAHGLLTELEFMNK